MQKIIFFTTFGCYLCEKVEQMFSQYFYEKGHAIDFELEVFDIIDDENILQKYRTKIPVLKNHKTKQEICWPFDYSEFKNWLEQKK